MAKSIRFNTNDSGFKKQSFSSNYGTPPRQVPLPQGDADRLQAQYDNLVGALENAGQTFDSRNWIEKALGINADTKQHAGIFSGTIDVLTRPLDAIKSSIFSVQNGGQPQDVVREFMAGITRGKGKNITGTQILGLENAHMDTFSKFIANVGIDIALDPLTYVPSGAIISGLKKVGTKAKEIPAIAKGLEKAGATELGQATKQLITTTKNALGKRFQWMYGVSPETRKLISEVEADRNHTVTNLLNVVNDLTNTSLASAEDVFKYANDGTLPANPLFTSQFKTKAEQVEHMEKTIEGLGVRNPEHEFKKWIGKHYNGNYDEGLKNILSFIGDYKNRNFQQEWRGFRLSRNWQNPNGTTKDLSETAGAFWGKYTKDWEQLTPELIKQRMDNGIYETYILQNPPTRKMENVIRGLDGDGFIIPSKDPEHIRKFLGDFGDTFGLKPDPLLRAKTAKKTYKNEFVVDKEIVSQAKKEVQEAEKKVAESLEKVKKGNKEVYVTKQAERSRLKAELKEKQSLLKQAERGINRTEFIDLSEANHITNGFPQSSYFEIIPFTNSEARNFALENQETLELLRKSPDPKLRAKAAEMEAKSEFNNLQRVLQDVDAQGVKIKIRKEANSKLDGLEFFDESGNAISLNEKLTGFRKSKGGTAIKENLMKEIKNNLTSYQKGVLTEEILEQGVLGKVQNKWQLMNGLTLENTDKVAKDLADEILKLKVEVPQYQLTPYNGYMSSYFVNQLTFLNSELYRFMERQGLDPSYLSQHNVLRNVINPEFANLVRLNEIRKTSKDGKLPDIITSGLQGRDASRVLDSSIQINALEFNQAAGYKFLSDDFLESIATQIKILPQEIGIGGVLSTAFKSGDIRKLSDIEKLSYKARKFVPEKMAVVNAEEITRRLDKLSDVIPKEQLEYFTSQLDLIKEEDKLLVAYGLYDELKAIDNAEKQVLPLANILNKYLGFWKKSILVTPGYHGRNAFGNYALSISAGIPIHELQPQLNRAFSDSYKIRQITDKVNTKLKYLTEDLSTLDKFNDFTKSFLKADEHALFTEYQELVRRGIVGQSKVQADFWEITKKIGKTSKKNSKFKQGVETVFDANFKISMIQEDGFRWATYRLGLENPKYADRLGLIGANASEKASSLVRFTYFDYHAMTSFEKNVMKKIFPFYSFTRKNLEFQLRTLALSPEKFTRLPKMFEDWNKAQEFNSEETPDYIKDKMYLPIVTGDKVKFLKVGLPQQDIAEVFSSNGSILSRLNPFAKLVLETITGKDTYTQKDTTPMKSLESIFWTPYQKLLVQPFDIPLGALPTGNGQTFGEILGHPNDYNERNSMWYEQNIQSLYQSYLWQQIQQLNQFRATLRQQGIEVLSNAQLRKQFMNNGAPTNVKPKGYKQFRF